MPHSETNFWGDLHLFDPYQDDVPWYLPKKLAEIVSRCKALLRMAPLSQLKSAAEAIESLIEDYFASERAALIERILETGSWELGYLPADQRDAVGLSKLLDEWPSEADDPRPEFPNSETRSDLQALIECIDTNLLNEWSGNEQWEEPQYFAVLALRKVADCIRRFDPEDPALVQLEKSLGEVVRSVTGRTTWPTRGFERMALEDLVEATEAVCWAERQRDFTMFSYTLDRLGAESIEAKRAFEEQLRLADQARRSEMAKAAADKRHLENRQMKADVWAWCEINLADYSSNDSAAEAIVYEIRLVPVKFRTARDWIAQWRKQVRSAGRP